MASGNKLEVTPHGEKEILMTRVFDSWERLFSQAVLWRDGLERQGWQPKLADVAVQLPF